MTEEIHTAEKMFFSQVFGKAASRQVNRCRAACRITKVEHRRKLLARKMALQFQKCTQDMRNAAADPERGKEFAMTTHETNLTELRKRRIGGSAGC